MSSTVQNLSTAMRRLASIDPEQPSCFENLVALNAARNCIEALFKSCSEELSSDPETADLWEAVASAAAVQSKDRKSKNLPVRTSQQYENPARSDEQAEMFWNAFADKVAWDFLPVDFLHALYTQWMSEQFPGAVQFSKGALTRRLKRAAAKSGDWHHSRSRPGSLMRAAEPLAERVPEWSHDGSNATIYGFRRSGM